MKNVALILKLLATGTLTMLLAACYGTIQMMYSAMYGVPYSQRSGMLKVQSPDTIPMPIPAIKVTFYSTVLDANQLPDSTTWQPLGQGYTNFDGMLQYTEYLDDDELLLAELEDIDGVDNGGPYASQVITVNDPEEIIMMEEIVPIPVEP